MRHASGTMLRNFCGVAKLSKPKQATLSTCDGAFVKTVHKSHGADKWGNFTRFTLLHTPGVTDINATLVLDVWIYQDDTAHTRLSVEGGDVDVESNWMAPIDSAAVSLEGLSPSPSPYVLLVPFDNDMYSVYEPISSTGKA